MNRVIVRQQVQEHGRGSFGNICGVCGYTWFMCEGSPPRSARNRLAHRKMVEATMVASLRGWLSDGAGGDLNTAVGGEAEELRGDH